MSMTPTPPGETLRPRDLAWLLLASRDLLPRQRARDQQADLAGMQLKRRVLDRLAALDPEPAELEAALVPIIEEIRPPTRPTPAIAAELRDEWRVARTTPEWV